MSSLYKQHSTYSVTHKRKKCCGGKQTGVVLGCIVLVVVLLAVVFFMVSLRAVHDEPRLADGLVETETTCGPVQGSTEDGGCVFRGIPYAVPPVEDLRWRKTVPLEKMEDCWTGTYLAHESKPVCPQNAMNGRFVRSSEDCLYLDVYTSDVSYADPRPVVVYFAGDSFFGDDEVSIRLRPSARLARETNVVFVVVRYRLNTFGFLALRTLRHHGKTPHASGNYGLHDMLAALNWVFVNIDNFGGNPRNVALLGHGSSATGILGLIVSPFAKGLFNKAWIVGGASDFVNVSLEEVENQNAEMLKKVKCKSAHCLLHVSSRKLLDAFPWKEMFLDLPYKDERIDSIAVVDGELVTDLPSNILGQPGQFNDVTLVIGVDPFDPWNIRAINLNSTVLSDRVTSRLRTFSADLAAKAVETYSTDKGISPKAFVQMIKDQRVVCPLMRLAQKMKKKFVNKVTVLSVSYIHDELFSSQQHRLDIAAIFDQLPQVLGNYGPEDEAFGRSMRKLFTSFINGSWENRVDPPGYVDVNGRDIVTNVDPYPNCEFWEASEVYPRHKKYN